MKRGAEFSVFQGGSPTRRPTPRPAPSDNLNLRKQRSLGNLTLLSDGEQRVYSFELPDDPLPPPPPPPPRRSLSSVSGSMSASSSPVYRGGRKEPGARAVGDARGTRARSLSLSLTKMLSHSEHSLIPVPWRTSKAGVAQRGSQGQGQGSQQLQQGGHHAQRATPPQGASPQRAGSRPTSRPPSNIQEVGAAADEEEGSTSERSEDDESGGARGDGAQDGGGGFWGDVEAGCGREDRAQLDKEVILTMLGDLEQVLKVSHPSRK